MTLEQLEQQAKELNDKIETFKKQLAEKQKQKSYTWSECFQRKGFYLSDDSKIIENSISVPLPSHCNLATNEKVITSNLAACKLSHIIEAINKDFEGSDNLSVSMNYQKNTFSISIRNWSMPRINTKEAAKVLIKTNRSLLLEYFGVEPKKTNTKIPEQTKLEFTRICELDSCQKPFLHSIHNQKFCSDKCRKSHYESKKQLS